MDDERLSIIVAVDENAGYVNRREIPWSFISDWNHFKATTKNNICIMGRRTYEDIADRRKIKTPNFEVLLPARESYVVSRSLQGQVQGATVVRSVEEVVNRLPKDDHRELFLLGGFRLWTQYWDRVSQIWLTLIPGTYETTKRFPVEWIDSDFKIVEGRDEKEGDQTIRFIRYVREREYYTINVHPSQLRQFEQHFRRTSRLVSTTVNTVTFIDPSEAELDWLRQVSNITSKRELVRK